MNEYMNVSNKIFQILSFTAVVELRHSRVVYSGVLHHLEVKDDGPYQAQGQLGVSICNVIIPDVDQLDLTDNRHRLAPKLSHTLFPDSKQRLRA